LLLLFLVVCIHAKTLDKLKSLSTLKQEKKTHAAQTKQHQVKRLKASVVHCYSAEDANYDPRTSATGHVKMDSAAITSTAVDVVKMLDEWRASTVVGVWPHIEKGVVIESVIRRLDNPARIQQASAPVCGPASIIFWLVVRRPYDYIRMARSLYETGVYNDDISKFTVTASDNHKNMEVGHGMDPVDWIVLVALRTSANLILNVDQFGDLWGVTTPGEMVTWTKNILGFANAADSGILIGDQSAVLERAQKSVNGDAAGDSAEGVATLLVDASIVQAADTVIDVPNHWIAFVSSLEITETEIKFRAFTWGQICDISANREEWQGKGFGVVWGDSPDIN